MKQVYFRLKLNKKTESNPESVSLAGMRIGLDVDAVLKAEIEDLQHRGFYELIPGNQDTRVYVDNITSVTLYEFGPTGGSTPMDGFLRNGDGPLLSERTIMLA